MQGLSMEKFSETIVRRLVPYLLQRLWTLQFKVYQKVLSCIPKKVRHRLTFWGDNVVSELADYLNRHSPILSKEDAVYVRSTIW